MKTLKFSIRIDAPREMVWEATLGEASFREWTAEFQPGSHYVGDWSEGSRILFLGPDDQARNGQRYQGEPTIRAHVD